jgi:hypothetical protein
MRCYLVKLRRPNGAERFRYAATNAGAKEVKEQFCDLFDLGSRTKEITITPAEIPTAKADLLEFVNKFAVKLDTDMKE